MYLTFMYKPDSALYKLQGLIYHKTQSTDQSYGYLQNTKLGIE